MKTDHEHTSLDRFRKRRVIRWWHVLLLFILGLGVWYASTILIALHRIHAPAIITDSSHTRTSVEALSDSSQPYNILLIGIGGGNHPGAELADSVMIASIDAKDKTISLLSIPRDLYVTTPLGYKDKINAVQALGEQHKAGYGPVWLEQTITKTFGIPINAYVKLDFTGFKDIIDSLGGVTVNVKTAINDPFYPDDKTNGYAPFYISAGEHHLDGATALKYARSRETTTDFDRARRQQEIVSAVKDKVLTTQTLANPIKVTSIISILGQHIVTNLSDRDMLDLLLLAKNMNNPTINNKVLDNSEEGMLISSKAANGAFILIPRSGNFDEIKAELQAYLAAPGIKAEKPTVLLEHTSNVTKTALDRTTKELTDAGFTVDTPAVDDAPVATESALFDLTEGKKPNSRDFFKTVYALTPEKNNNAVTPTPTDDFVLVIDSSFNSVSSTKSTSLLFSPTPRVSVKKVSRALATPLSTPKPSISPTLSPTDSPTTTPIASPSADPIPTISPVSN